LELDVGGRLLVCVRACWGKTSVFFVSILQNVWKIKQIIS